MGAVAGAVVGGVIVGRSVKKAGAAADDAAAQASDAQAQAIEDARILAEERERELEEERKRIFEATKPQEEAARFTFGLGNRGDMGGFSDFISPTSDKVSTSTGGMSLNSSTILGGF